MARQKLAPDPAVACPDYPVQWPDHADFHYLTVPDDKKTIGIDQVRELVDELNLTSYEGVSKAAVIEPADKMTSAAANSLLKTLEEPAGDALIILVADRVGRLPATIFSRCQRIDIAVPAGAVALQWLNDVRPGSQWGDALQLASGAPLGALSRVETLEDARSLGRDLQTLGKGQGSAVETAARWARLDPEFVLNWLEQQVRLAIRAKTAGRHVSPGLAIDDSVLSHMDSRNLFCYLDRINRLRAQTGGSFNVQMAFEGLLIDWAERLTECLPQADFDGLAMLRERQQARPETKER